MILLIIPLSCEAVFWDKWFEDLLPEEYEGNQTPSTMNFLNSSTGQAEVINEIKVETNTGGNVIEGGDGEVIEGKGESKVEIKTIINGKEIESISTESDKGEIKVKQEVLAEQGEEPVVNTEIQANPEPEAELEPEKNFTPIRELILSFLDNFKSIFLGIFNIFKL